MEENETGYYSVLGIEKTNCRETIWRGFWNKVKDNHPIKKPDIICEAYEVLSTPELKEIYDNYGESVLKSGLPNLSQHSGYVYKGKCFLKLYTTLHALEPEVPSLSKKNEKDLWVDLTCTLRELYNGCIKSISYKKDQLPHYSSRKVENLHFEKEIEIKPGFKDGQEIRFVGEGHDAVGKVSSDLVIKIHQTPDPDFKRVGNNLIYTKHITLEDAILAESYQIKTLDDRELFVSVDEIISQQTATIISGEGMPIITAHQHELSSLSGSQEKGDLIIRYDIEFPKFLSNAQKDAIESIF